MSAKKKLPPRAKVNGYRKNSNYALCYDLLYQMGKHRPVSRRTLIERYSQLSGKDLRRAKFDITVVLSPTEDGKFHRSAESASRRFPYYVKRLADGMVQLVVK